MGVLTCSRKHCDNIMCDTYVDGVGYICRECQDEFINYVRSERLAIYSEYQLPPILNGFLETTRKGEFDQQEGTIDLRAFFNKHTKQY